MRISLILHPNDNSKHHSRQRWLVPHLAEEQLAGHEDQDPAAEPEGGVALGGIQMIDPRQGGAASDGVGDAEANHDDQLGGEDHPESQPGPCAQTSRGEQTIKWS